jgi:hypothetical protein
MKPLRYLSHPLDRHPRELIKRIPGEIEHGQAVGE